MNNDGIELIDRAIAAFRGGQPKTELPTSKGAAFSPLMQSLMGESQSTSVNLHKLQSALDFLNPDMPRGNGSFFDANGEPKSDCWMAAVWAARSTNDPAAKEIAKNWSQKALDRYTEEGFELAWNSYNPNHARPVGVGSLYKYAIQLGWQYSPLSEPRAAAKYKLLGGKDIAALPPVKWRVKGVWPYEGLAAIYGPSGSGKSFLAFDLAATIAEGAQWFGNRTTQSTVVYVALEGESSFKNRVAAWELDNGCSLPEDLLMVMQPFHLTAPQDIDDLADAIPKGAVVMVDTLNRAAPTSDENSSREMGEILEACKRLQGLIGGLVVLIHHTGKDATRGARGHSSFFAALDGAIEVERTATQRAWSVAKAKDGQDGIKTVFELKLHVLGTDPEGDEITSCTIAPAIGNVFVKPQPKGQSQQAALKVLVQRVKSLTDPPNAGLAVAEGDSRIKFEDAVKLVAETLYAKPKNKRINEARRLLTALDHGGFISLTVDEEHETWCRLV